MTSTLEAIYYSAPIPRNLGVLTVLGAVFDKVYFPGVYLPKEGFDLAELDKEIERLKGLGRPTWGASELIGMLNFVRHAKTLDGFCVFTGKSDEVFGNTAGVTAEFAGQIFETIHGRSPVGWVPVLDTGHHKGIPGSEESINWPGRYHYYGKAILESAETKIPLVNDRPKIPLPGADDVGPADDAQLLSILLSIESVKLVFPNLPLLHPEDLMEFRHENSKSLQAFRRSMLRYAADFNDKVLDIPSDQLERKTRFFVDTEVAPALDELRDAVNAPARAWHKRAVDAICVVPKFAAACFAADPTAAIVKVLMAFAGTQFITELSAAGDKSTALKRSGLYYLLALETHRTE